MEPAGTSPTHRRFRCPTFSRAPAEPAATLTRCRKDHFFLADTGAEMASVVSEPELDRSGASIGRRKWADPARAPFDGIVDEVNEMLIERPGALVDDPYHKGWILVVRPSLSEPLEGLATGDAVTPAYASWMAVNDFRGCGGEIGP